jgi:hypothetical protein
MKTILKAVTVILLSYAGCACASPSEPKQSPPEDSEWVRVASTDDYLYAIRKGSFEITKTKAGIPIAVVVLQMTEIKPQTISYLKNYVTKDDCLNGLGKLVALDTTGQYLHENDFVYDGNNVASSIASVICLLYKDELKKQSDKSI